MDLIQAVKDENLAAVQRLIRGGADVNFVDNNPEEEEEEDQDKTPLHWAAERGNVPIGLTLIQAGANLNSLDVRGDTPLMLAAYEGNTDFVVLLLEQTGLDLKDALSEATRHGHLEIVNLLLDSGADPNKDVRVWEPPLFGAINESNTHRRNKETMVEIIKSLLKHGADINFQYRGGATPLMWTISKPKEVVNVLLADPNLNIDIQDNSGRTALYKAAYAAYAPYFNVVKLLINAGADPFITDNQGKKPSEIASSPEVRKLLIRYEKDYTAAKLQADKDVANRAMLARRMTRGVDFPAELQLPQRQLPQYILGRSAYDELCLQLDKYNTKPQIQALARSLGITPGNLSKAALCNAIWEKLTL